MDINKTYSDIYEYIKNNLSEKRLKHCLNVEKEAVKLGEKYGADIDKCRLAGIAHDCLKNLSFYELTELIEKYHMSIDSIQLKSPQILHGPVGAEFCKEHFGINDNDILNAIKYHTTGRNGMSLLEKIIFISDLIEEGRNFPGVDTIRDKTYVNLNEALLMACNETIVYVVKSNGLLHPLTVEFRNSLIMKG